MSAFTFLDGAFLAATQVSGEQTVDVAITGMPMQMAAVVTQPATVDVAIVGSPMTMAAVLSSGAPPSGDADADAYIALLGGTYSGAEEDAIDAFVVALKGRTLSDGGSQWASLTEFWICALDNSTDALLGLKGNFALQTQNAPTFTAREGFKLNGSTQSLFSAINPSVRSSVERGVAGAYTRLGSTNECVIFSADEGQGSYLEHYGDGFGLYGSLLFAGLYREPTGTYNGSATVTLNATDIVLCLNQTAFSEESGGFVAPPDSPEVRWGRYGPEIVFSVSDDQFAACWVGFEGKGWTVAETQAFHADVETLLDVFGAGVIP